MPKLTHQEVERRLSDLLACTVIDYKPLRLWELKGREVALPYFVSATPDTELKFRARASLPNVEGAKWLLRLDITGNGLLVVDGEPCQGIDEQHRIAVVEPGERELVLETTPRRLFGEAAWQLAFLNSSATAVMWEGFHLALSLLDLLQLARQKEELMRALERAVEEVELTPSVLQAQALVEALYGYLRAEGSPEYKGPRWELAYAASVYGDPVASGALEDTPRPSVSEVLRTLDRVKGALDFGPLGPRGRVYLFGHSHIDTAWLWPFSETKRKVRRTFATLVRLAKMGYRFTYVQSGAQNYKWLEEQDSKLFAEVGELVRRGLWLPVGGMWVESDTQLVAGESLARQLLYGQLYFMERFGRRCRIGWLPDSFGFSAQLPQLLRGAGIEVFVTHKMVWNDTNEFPYHAFVWEGLDGSEVVAHVIVTTYNGVLTASELAGLWEKYKQRDVAPAVHSYGFGDGGGGPTFLMFERLKLLKGVPQLPEPLEAPSEEEYASELLKLRGLPRWRGEIYNEFHRGVYTTNARIKILMAQAESEALWAEATAALASLLGLTEYPRDELRGAWERVLCCQFHDVLPGSSNREAYEEAYRDMEGAIRALSSVTGRALKSIAEAVDAPSGSVVVSNRLGWPVEALVEVPGLAYTAPDGRPVEVQELEGRRVARTRVPALGYTTLVPASSAEPARGGARAYAEGGNVVVENELVRVVIGSDCTMLSLYDKELGEELLAAPSNALRAHSDKPGICDAWDIDRSTAESPGHPLEVVEGPRVVASGPLVAAVEYALKFKSSVVRQRVVLVKGLKLVEVRSTVDWKDKCYLLKAWFELVGRVERGYYEVPFGVVERTTVPRDRWDEAKYEVPALKWADFTDGRVGLAIISPARHGYSARGSRVGLSLLKAPFAPNPWSDMERCEFSYYLYPHRGDYREGEVYRRAYEVWAGARALVKKGSGGRLPREAGAASLPRGVILEALKLGEREGVVARICEVEGSAKRFELQLPVPVQVYEASLLEEPERQLGSGSRVAVELRPFEVKTLLIKLSSATSCERRSAGWRAMASAGCP